MERESFVVKASWYEAVQELSDPMERLACIESVFNYAFMGIEPEVKGIVSMFFKLVKPQVDLCNMRREIGKLGGRPRKEKFPEKATTPSQEKSSLIIIPNSPEDIAKSSGENNITESKKRKPKNQNKTKIKPNKNQIKTKVKTTEKPVITKVSGNNDNSINNCNYITKTINKNNINNINNLNSLVSYSYSYSENEKENFHPPTIAEVKKYIDEHFLNVNPVKFVSYYDSRNWRTSGNCRIRDWKNALRFWHRTERASPVNTPRAKPVFLDFEQRDYDMAALEQMILAN